MYREVMRHLLRIYVYLVKKKEKRILYSTNSRHEHYLDIETY